MIWHKIRHSLEQAALKKRVRCAGPPEAAALRGVFSGISALRNDLALSTGFNNTASAFVGRVTQQCQHLGWVADSAGAGVAAGGCISLGVQRLGNICVRALCIKAPAVVGTHQRAVQRLYAPLCRGALK